MRKLLRLDLACGRALVSGFKGVDLYRDDCERVDLCRFPWPWSDDSVEELRCSHFVEHVPSRCVEERDIVLTQNFKTETHFRDEIEFVGRDMLCAFMEEAHRVLVPGGKFTVIAPHARSHGAFQDPTHRRYLVEETFYYFDRQWRIENGVDHYTARCDFEIHIALRADPRQEAAMSRLSKHEIAQRWNLVDEIVCTMTKREALIARTTER